MATRQETQDAYRAGRLLRMKGDPNLLLNMAMMKCA